MWDSIEEELPYIAISEMSPSSPVQDMVWVDTSTSPPEWKQWNGSEWVSALPAFPVDIVRSEAVRTIWSGTQEEYDAIETLDSNTLYVIV
jgi:hypothetical protein